MNNRFMPEIENIPYDEYGLILLKFSTKPQFTCLLDFFKMSRILTNSKRLRV